MKKTGIAAIATAGVIALGGGAWAVTTLPASSDGTVTSAPVETSEPTPTPTVEQTPDVTPTIDPTAAPEQPDASELDVITDIYLPWARTNYDDYAARTPSLPTMTDGELIAALEVACGSLVDGSIPAELSVIPGFATAADLDSATWEDEANRLFTSAARLGYGPNITGESGSYCG